MLADPEIEAVYNPLPNHMHVPWSIKAAEAGKHVLCEKPISITLDEAKSLKDARDRTGKLITEAFMVRFHPQWQRTRELARSGRIGEVRAIQGFFSYFNRDPENVRNILDIGGGANYDIGCYPIVTARYVFGEEPRRVAALVERDPDFGTDRLTSALLDFPSGQLTYTCSTQLVPYQRMNVYGTEGRIEVMIPFNAPPDEPCRIRIDDGSKLGDASVEVEEFPVCDQYELQGAAFSEMVRNGTAPEFGLEDTVNNMAAILAVLKAGDSGDWVDL